jgi:alpha-mannosidase
MFAGEHQFSWAVLPHEGHFLESDVPMAAYLFNSPLRGNNNLEYRVHLLSDNDS